jgi:hypothetical protein
MQTKNKCLNCLKPVKVNSYGKEMKYCSYACMYEYDKNKKEDGRNWSRKNPQNL